MPWVISTGTVPAARVREARTREVVRRDLPQQVDEGRPGVEPRAEGGKGWLHHAASLYGGLLGAGR